MRNSWLLVARYLILLFGFFQSAWVFAQDTVSGESEISQLVASPIEGGYSWTLASRLGEIISMAEEKYGERDHAWTLLGVEFKGGGNPAVWYPFSNDGKRYAIIQLTRSAANNEKRALFQLSHEVIHLLSPDGGQRRVNVFEEGLAVHFSIAYLNRIGIKASDAYVVNADYKRAYILMSQLYALFDDVDATIRRIREERGGFRQLVLADMQHYFPGIDRVLAANLVKDF